MVFSQVAMPAANVHMLSMLRLHQIQTAIFTKLLHQLSSQGRRCKLHSTHTWSARWFQAQDKIILYAAKSSFSLALYGPMQIPSWLKVQNGETLLGFVQGKPNLKRKKGRTKIDRYNTCASPWPTRSTNMVKCGAHLISTGYNCFAAESRGKAISMPFNLGAGALTGLQWIRIEIQYFWSCQKRRYCKLQTFLYFSCNH